MKKSKSTSKSTNKSKSTGTSHRGDLAEALYKAIKSLQTPDSPVRWTLQEIRGECGGTPAADEVSVTIRVKTDRENGSGIHPGREG
jgi:hypothetical protein